MNSNYKNWKLAFLLSIMIIFCSEELLSQQCGESFSSVNLNEYVETEFGPNILSVWACQEIGDTKIEQKVYFNIRNLTKDTLYVSFNLTTYTDGGTAEKLREDSLFKSLLPEAEISGAGAVVDDDMWIKLTKVHSYSNNKVAQIELEVFSISKLVNRKEFPFKSKNDTVIESKIQPDEQVPNPLPDSTVKVDPNGGANVQPGLGISSNGDQAPPQSDNIAPEQKVENTPSKKLSKKEQKQLQKEEEQRIADQKKLDEEKEKENKANALKEEEAEKLRLADEEAKRKQQIEDEKKKGTTNPEVNSKDSTIQAGPSRAAIEKAKVQVVEKIKQLEVNFTQLSKKDLPMVAWQNTINNTVRLFVDEDQHVQISSIYKKSITAFKIRIYCQRLKTVLAYDSASIENANVYFVTDFKKNPKGQWEALYAYTQRFTGFRDEKPIYSDITEKTIRVILDYKPQYIDGKQEDIWELLLGDIKVLSTRNL